MIVARGDVPLTDHVDQEKVHVTPTMNVKHSEYIIFVKDGVRTNNISHWTSIPLLPESTAMTMVTSVVRDDVLQ